MPRGERRWSGEGAWSREIFISEDGGNVLDVETEVAEPVFQPLLPLLKANNVNDGEIVVEFSVAGWHTPASMYGGPDRLGWPEEGGEERTVERTYLRINVPTSGNPLDERGRRVNNARDIKIPDTIANPILAKFDREIEQTEYKADEYDPNDREPDFESVIKTVSEIITEDINVNN